jgi:hypothetical protein
MQVLVVITDGSATIVKSTSLEIHRLKLIRSLVCMYPLARRLSGPYRLRYKHLFRGYEDSVAIDVSNTKSQTSMREILVVG